MAKRREQVSFNTASGKYYCNNLNIYIVRNDVKLVSIPQAVSTIAICPPGLRIITLGFVSIPQAVSTIAIQKTEKLVLKDAL